MWRRTGILGLMVAVLALTVALVAPAPVAAATPVNGGDVSGTWTAAGSPYLVQGEVTVPAGQTLTIEPGVEVVFQTWNAFVVNGTLLAEGTAANPILFTTDTSPGWLGVRFVNASDDSRLTYAIVEKGYASGASPFNSGGGVYIEGSSPTISFSTIRNNYAKYAGAGLYLTSSDAILHDNLILNNHAGLQASAYGGGIYMISSNPELTRNVIRGNSVGVAGSFSTPYGEGGGIFSRSSNPVLRHNIIADNSVSGSSSSYARGGAAYFYYGSPVLVANTVTSNTVGTGGGYYQFKQGGAFYLYNSQLTLVNNILWANTAKEGAQFYIEGTRELVVAYTDVGGGAAGVVNSEGAPITQLGGNIDADPRFVDPAAGDYVLQSNSKAIDAGTAYLAYNGTVYVDLQPAEYSGAAPDMGALETGGSSLNQPPVAVAAATPDRGSAPLTVAFSSDGSSDPDGTIVAYAWDFGDGSGATEANPMHTYDAVGDYTATLTVTDDDGAVHSATVTVTVVDGTTVLAGDVSGTWTPAGAPYRVDGDIVVPAGQTLTVEAGTTVLFESWYKLTVNGTLVVAGTEAAPVLFTAPDTTSGWLGIRFVNASDASSVTYAIIEKGHASGAAPENGGGGIYIEGSSPTISHSTIRDNDATYAGGGIYLTNSNAILRDNLIENNAAGFGGSAYGGGIYMIDSNPELTRNVIRGNTVGVAGTYSTPYGEGGAIFARSSSPVLRGNVIVGNRVNASANSYARGGGLYLYYGSPVLANNTIADNGVSTGGGVYSYWQGGGLYLYNSQVTLVNDIVWGNVANEGEEIYIEGGAQLTVAYSDVDTSAGSIVNSEVAPIVQLGGNLSLDPRFVDPANGDYSLQANSPAVDAGTAQLVYNGTTYVDLAPGEYSGNAPDMGALESPYSGSTNQPPAVAISASPTGGVAPLTVQFSSDGSTDSDGEIVGYVWDFGDGGTATEANPAHTYTAAGTYEAVLVVTDDGGATGTATVTITVDPAAEPDLHVQAQTVTRDEKRRRARALDTVLIADQAGLPVGGASVTVQYSGPNSGQLNGTTGSDGTVTLVTPWARRPQGTWCFTVTAVAKEGYTYNPAANVLTTVCETP